MLLFLTLLAFGVSLFFITRKFKKFPSTDYSFQKNEVPRASKPVVIPEYRIIYIDVKLDESVREITVKSVQMVSDGDINIRCFCHKRSGLRTFKASRIKELVDISTGEIISNPKEYFQSRMAA